MQRPRVCAQVPSGATAGLPFTSFASPAARSGCALTSRRLCPPGPVPCLEPRDFGLWFFMCWCGWLARLAAPRPAQPHLQGRAVKQAVRHGLIQAGQGTRMPAAPGHASSQAQAARVQANLEPGKPCRWHTRLPHLQRSRHHGSEPPCRRDEAQEPCRRSLAPHALGRPRGLYLRHHAVGTDRGPIPLSRGGARGPARIAGKPPLAAWARPAPAWTLQLAAGAPATAVQPPAEVPPGAVPVVGGERLGAPGRSRKHATAAALEAGILSPTLLHAAAGEAWPPRASASRLSVTRQAAGQHRARAPALWASRRAARGSSSDVRPRRSAREAPLGREDKPSDCQALLQRNAFRRNQPRGLAVARRGEMPY